MNPIPLPNEYEYNPENAIKYIQEMKKKENLELLNKRSKELRNLVLDPNQYTNFYIMAVIKELIYLNYPNYLDNEILFDCIIRVFENIENDNYFWNRENRNKILDLLNNELFNKNLEIRECPDYIESKLVDIFINKDFQDDLLKRASVKIFKLITTGNAELDIDLIDDINTILDIIKNSEYNLEKREIISILKKSFEISDKYKKLGFRIPDRIHDRYDLYISKYKPKTYSEYEEGFIRVLGDKI